MSKWKLIRFAAIQKLVGNVIMINAAFILADFSHNEL